MEPMTMTLLAGSAAAGAGGSILGGIFGGNASKKQAEAIRYSADLARQTALELDDKARADMAPFRQLGVQAGPTLMGLLDGSVDVSKYLEASPMFQFQSEIGERNINRQLAARGQYNSGAGLETLAMFNQGLAAEEGQRIYDRLFKTTELGANAAAKMAGGTSATGVSLAELAQSAGAGIGQAYAKQGTALGGGVAGAFSEAGNALMYGPLLSNFLDRQPKSTAGMQQEAYGQGVVSGTKATLANYSTYNG